MRLFFTILWHVKNRKTEKNKKNALILTPARTFKMPYINGLSFLLAQAVEKYGTDKIKIYQSKFVNMYYAVSDTKPKTGMKLVCLLPEEKVGNLIFSFHSYTTTNIFLKIKYS